MGMSWVVEVVSILAPEVAPKILKVLERLKDKDESVVLSTLTLSFLALLYQQNQTNITLLNELNRKIDNSNEALAILLKRTER